MMDPPKIKKLERIPISDKDEMDAPHTPGTEYRLQQFAIIKHRSEDERKNVWSYTKNISVALLYGGHRHGVGYWRSESIVDYDNDTNRR